MSAPESLQSLLWAIQDGASATTLESERLDFKTVGRSDEDALADLAEASSCFANAQGGHIVVGVADRASGPEAFVGTTLDTARTQRRIYELTTPALIITVDAFDWAGSRLLALTIPGSPEVHQVRGKATERVGTSCEPMTAARIAAVVAERRGDDWSADDSHINADKVSARALDEARRLLSEAPDAERQRWSSLSSSDIFRRMGLLADTGSSTRSCTVTTKQQVWCRSNTRQHASPLLHPAGSPSASPLPTS